MADSTLPNIPSGEELYNALMSKIEPELVTSVIPTLKEKHKDETPEEQKARMQRYHDAYVAYEKALEEYMANLNKQIESYRKAAFASAEAKERAAEQAKLAELESTFSS